MDRESSNLEETIAAARTARAAGIEIIVVAVGKEVNDFEISQIASRPTSGHKITLSDYSEIAELKNKFYSLICP